MKNLLTLCLIAFTSFTLFTTAAVAQKSPFDTSSSSLFSNDDEFLKVDDAFNFNFYQNDNQLEITFDVAPEYYLYRHQFKFKGTNISFSPVTLPTGVDHDDEFFGIQKVFNEQLTFTINLDEVKADGSIKITYQGCAEKGLCYPPTKKVVELTELSKSKSAAFNPTLLTSTSNDTTESNKGELKSVNINSNISDSAQSEQHKLSDMLKQDSLLLTLVAFFVGGLLLSFTPCVFPMYPILTGIIVGQGKQGTPLTTKKAFTLSFIYVQGMAVTYTLLGVVVALAGAQFQAIFQHPAVLISLSILFIFLALSMFGVFNLAMPSSWQNKLNNISNQQKGGSIIGVLSMGVISGLVASPCTTAPLTGALLYISQTGDVILGASALYALSLGMGLPLLVLGSSGGKLLPKAGAWMNIIKNIFGLLLLAVPVFLLERLISETASQALWAILLLGSASYFYVANQNYAENKIKSFWYGLRSLIIFLMLFFGASMSYQLIFPNNSIVNEGHHPAFKQVTTLKQLNDEVNQANQLGKTVMVDLYADWCKACKEFEKYTFVDSEVQQALRNTVWLQVDMTDFDSKDNAELVQHYTILGLPSILFFNLEGKELVGQRTTGFMGAAQFTAHINSTFNK